MTEPNRVVIGADDAGFELKAIIESYLDERGVAYDDIGVDSPDATALGVDYPDVAERAATAIRDGRYERGILICGTGIGMSIVANRFPKVRAALCHDHFTAQMSRQHNDANVLVMGERVIGRGVACEILTTWLETEFEGGRHQLRLNKIQDIEKSIKG